MLFFISKVVFIKLFIPLVVPMFSFVLFVNSLNIYKFGFLYVIEQQSKIGYILWGLFVIFSIWIVVSIIISIMAFNVIKIDKDPADINRINYIVSKTILSLDIRNK
jgi:hypothetical protein